MEFHSNPSQEILSYAILYMRSERCTQIAGSTELTHLEAFQVTKPHYELNNNKY